MAENVRMFYDILQRYQPPYRPLENFQAGIKGDRAHAGRQKAGSGGTGLKRRQP